MSEDIKEISKVDKQLLDKIEHILGSELSSKEYNAFYNYFNEIRKPNILIDIKDDENIKGLITNLQEEKKQLKDGWQQEIYDKDKILNDWLHLQQRIGKAIEYIKRCRDYHKTYHSEDKMFADEITSLLMILKGRW